MLGLCVAEWGLERRRWGVKDIVGSDVCVGGLGMGKRVIVCVGSWRRIVRCPGRECVGGGRGGGRLASLLR